MRLRLTKVEEYQFLTCVKHEIWGSKSARFNDWKNGDYLAIIVDKQIAGLAEVSGAAFQSQEKVWDNGLFPNGITINLSTYLIMNIAQIFLAILEKHLLMPGQLDTVGVFSIRIC